MDQIDSRSKAETKRTVRVLFVEDNPADLKLPLLELKKAGFEVHGEHASTPEEFVARLRARAYDVIISGYCLKAWNARDALQLINEEGKDIPFILLTRALGDATAVDCIKSGVWDYILKDRLSRLPLAVCRAMEEKCLREEKRRTEAALRKSEAKFRKMVDTIAAAIFIYEGTRCRYTNRAAEVITGYGQKELLARSFGDLVHPDAPGAGIEKGFALLPGERPAGRHEMKILGKDGKAKWLDIAIGSIEFEGRRARLMTAVDITERKQLEEEIRLLAWTDPLTGLGNYRRLVDVIGAETERSQRTGRSFALILFDLDDLKKVNDTHGHQSGSRALCRVASVLRLNCRTVDTAVRYGGDEFALLLPETELAGAQSVAQRIAEQTITDGEEPPISVSFGIAVYPQDGGSIDEVIRRADAALYTMKAA